MKPAIAVLAVSLSALAAKNPAPQTIKFDLSKDGIEHIVGSFTVEVWKKSTTVSIVVQNNSPAQLRRVSGCVQGASGTCAFKFWNTETLPPGGSFRRTLTEAGELTGPFTAALEEIDPDKFAKIRRIYVEWIEGSDGVLAREQLMASLANSSRFKLVEDPKLADAFLRGHCEEREKGTLNQTSALEQSTNRSTGMKAGLAVGNGDGNTAGVLGVAGGVHRESGKTASDSTEWTEIVKTKNLALRLVTVEGEGIWGWDDSKPCQKQHPTCAIDDLVSTAR